MAIALGTEIILPEHFEVANAVGTVVGSVIVQQKGEVSPITSGTVITGYFGRAGSQQAKFNNYEDALAFARQTLARLVVEEAQSAGADAPQVECEEVELIPGMMMQLSAYAVGKPGLNGGSPA